MRILQSILTGMACCACSWASNGVAYLLTQFSSPGCGGVSKETMQIRRLIDVTTKS